MTRREKKAVNSVMERLPHLPDAALEGIIKNSPERAIRAEACRLLSSRLYDDARYEADTPFGSMLRQQAGHFYVQYLQQREC